jgi:hypothetical protein
MSRCELASVFDPGGLSIRMKEMESPEDHLRHPQPQMMARYLHALGAAHGGSIATSCVAEDCKDARAMIHLGWFVGPGYPGMAGGRTGGDDLRAPVRFINPSPFTTRLEIHGGPAGRSRSRHRSIESGRQPRDMQGYAARR